MIVNKDRDRDRDRRNSDATEFSAQDAEYGTIFNAYHGGIRGGASPDGEPDIYFLGIIDILQVLATSCCCCCPAIRYDVMVSVIMSVIYYHAIISSLAL